MEFNTINELLYRISVRSTMELAVMRLLKIITLSYCFFCFTVNAQSIDFGSFKGKPFWYGAWIAPFVCSVWTDVCIVVYGFFFVVYG